MDEPKLLVCLVAIVASMFVGIIYLATVDSAGERRDKRERLELILRSGDCKTLAAELAK